MAWQNAGAGQNVAQMVQPENHGAQAYTLQGVMRYLQTEWHKHERDRNAWDIERDEMKRRIALLEGEARSSKGLRNILERQIRMLEVALRKEREISAKIKNGEVVDTTKDSRELAREEIEKLKESVNVTVPRVVSQFDSEIDAEHHLAQSIRQDEQRKMSRDFLSNCSNEITARILPGIHLTHDMLDLNHVTTDNGPSQADLRAAYAELQAQKQAQAQLQHQNSMLMAARENPSPSHQSLPPHTDLNSAGRMAFHPKLSAAMTQDARNLSSRQQRQQPRDDELTPVVYNNAGRSFPDNDLQHAEEQVESVQHSYDAYGQELPPKDEYETQQSRTIEKGSNETADGWDFDEAPQTQQPMHNLPAMQRPDTEAFPTAAASKSPPRMPGSHRRKSSGARRSSSTSAEISDLANSLKLDTTQFKVRFAMRGHLDVVRSVVFTGGGSPADPEFATCGDDGTIKRWHIPGSYANTAEDLDRGAHFTHRGHIGAVCSLATCPTNLHFSNGGRVPGDGWIFSGGEDASVKVWERGRVDAKACLEGHTDSVWALCVLPGTTGSILGDRCTNFGGPDRLLLAAGASDGTILIWAVSAPPQSASASAGPNRGARGTRRANSISAGSNFPNSPQPSVASTTAFNYSLVHRIERPDRPSPTSISPLSASGDTFVVGYSNASALVFDTKTGEEIVGMASQETYDGTPNTGINAIVASSTGFDTREAVAPTRRGSMGEEDIIHGATGPVGGVEGLVIAGYEDRYIRFFDANSGQCTYTMLAHPSAISSLALSPDGRELVSGGHDASLRFWSLEKRNCTQEITNHRIMRGEGVCAVVWSADGRWVISAGGDGAVKVFSRNSQTYMTDDSSEDELEEAVQSQGDRRLQTAESSRTRVDGMSTSRSGLVSTRLFRTHGASSGGESAMSEDDTKPIFWFNKTRKQEQQTATRKRRYSLDEAIKAGHTAQPSSQGDIRRKSGVVIAKKRRRQHDIA